MWGYILIIFLNDFPVIEVQERYLFVNEQECMTAAKLVFDNEESPLNAACMPIRDIGG